MLEHNNVLLTGSGLYRVSMDCSSVETPLDYELTSLDNPEDRFMVSEPTVRRSFESEKWKKVNINK